MAEADDGADEARAVRDAEREAEAAAHARRKEIRRGLNPWTWGLLLIAFVLVFTWAVSQ